MNTKILVALVIAFAVVGLTGVASASMLGSYYHDFGSYAYTPIDYSSISNVETPSVFDSATFGSMYETPTFNIESPVHVPVAQTYSTGQLTTSYFSTYNGETISGTTVDSIPPFHIAEVIPFNGAIFYFEAFANMWP